MILLSFTKDIISCTSVNQFNILSKNIEINLHSCLALLLRIYINDANMNSSKYDKLFGF